VHEQSLNDPDEAIDAGRQRGDGGSVGTGIGKLV
jgi:hypothetical protein